MNRGRGTERYKITTALVWLVSTVFEINIHFDHVVVFVLGRFFEEEPFPDNDLFGSRVLKLHSGIQFRRCSKLGERRRGWLLDNSADWRTLR